MNNNVCQAKCFGVLLYSPGWPGACDHPASTLQVLGIEVCTTMSRKTGNFKWTLFVVLRFLLNNSIKKNEMLSFAGKWMELENIILSEVSLAQKTKNRMFSLICGH
jgi:hypothetical protein